jgi:hypothetical protein
MREASHHRMLDFGPEDTVSQSPTLLGRDPKNAPGSNKWVRERIAE